MKWKRQLHFISRKQKNKKLKECTYNFRRNKWTRPTQFFRHRTEQKGRSVILEREIFNLQNKYPWEGLLETSKKGSSAKPQKTTTTKIRSKTENSKTVKTYKCSHPSSQNLNRSDTELTSGAHRGFAAFRDQWRRIMTALVKEKPESK